MTTDTAPDRQGTVCPRISGFRRRPFVRGLLSISKAVSPSAVAAMVSFSSTMKMIDLVVAIKEVV